LPFYAGQNFLIILNKLKKGFQFVMYSSYVRWRSPDSGSEAEASPVFGALCTPGKGEIVRFCLKEAGVQSYESRHGGIV
jgi:hypothetical protein